MNNNISAIGIDVGGSRVKAAIVSPDGSLSKQIVERSRVSDPYPAIRDQLKILIEKLLDLSKSPPVAVGIGIAGLMNFDRRLVIAAPNCPGVVGQPLADDLEKLLRLPVVIENDANVMALGEGSWGAAKGSKHYVAVTLGTGVGGAIVYNGELLRGWKGGGSEIGHICIDRHGPLCGCGASGCLEAFIGLKGISRWIQRSAGSLYNIHMVRLSEMALHGDKDAIRLFEWIGKTLGIAMAGIVNLLNPETIVVGGGIAAAGPMLFDPLRMEIANRAFQVYQPGLKIVPAVLGNWAGVVGAANLARMA